MKKKLLIILVIIFTNHFGKAGDILYRVSDIPAELRENARSVIRSSSWELIVSDINKATLKISEATTVLNKAGIEDANLVMHYDKYLSVSAIKGRVYDENGEMIKKIAYEDIEDLSSITGYSLYEDNRMKFVDPEIRQVPFTVEYSCEITLHGILDYPDWFPQGDFNISIEKGTYKVIIPKNLELRYLELHFPGKARLTSDEANNIYQWEILNQRAIKEEPLSPDKQDIFPLVMVAPTDFEIGGYKGNSSTWLKLGDWINSLNTGRDILLPETVSELYDLVKDCKTEQEKICRIYQYMQGRVRYVNLDIGMGGWQPIDAATVHRLSYGDCKALTNYMKAMLKAVGIHSYYCIVSAGLSAPGLITSFPSMQFNHVILCVPVNQDTVWLECTSQHSPCGYLGGFTEGRDVLMIDQGNSRLIRTRALGLDENVKKSMAEIRFDETGMGSMNIRTTYSGLDYDDIQSIFLADDQDQVKMISDRMTFPLFQLVDFNYEETGSRNPVITEEIQVNFENFLTVINSRYIMPLNCTGHATGSPAAVRNRKTDVILRHEFLEVDSLVFFIPESLKIGSIPENAEVSSQFGTYRSSVIPDENKLIYIRTLQFNRGDFPVSSYTELIDFMDRVIMADHDKCVFVRNE